MPAELPLFLRISATDWADRGWTIEDSVELARIVKPLGVDLIDASSGGNAIHARIPVAPGYQVPLAEQIRQESGIRTGAVGLITDARQAEAIVESGQADIVLLARELLRDPYFPMHAAQELGAPVSAPNQYLRAFPGSVSRSAAEAPALVPSLAK
jgi:2,4-dienoyl-CoA reductase-like NADH-dependent reductase (Old Yellow Enzyme family)